jgi:hypothetical protein
VRASSSLAFGFRSVETIEGLALFTVKWDDRRGADAGREYSRTSRCVLPNTKVSQYEP